MSGTAGLRIRVVLGLALGLGCEQGQIPPAVPAAALAASAEQGEAAPPRSADDRPGFAAYVVDGRLWVVRDGREEHEAFRQDGPPARSVTRVAAGPDRMSVRAVDGATIDADLAVLESGSE